MSAADLAPRRIVFNADDFGLDVAVNEAVESAFRNGLLTSASLMVSAPAAADAVARARALPGLGVGLHLTLVDGTPTLPADQIPDLVDDQGRFAADLWRRGFRYFFLARVRRQLAAEIRAQFEAFAATGLSLDHANAHKHLHVHPTVLRLLLDIGKDYGLGWVRLPWEPLQLKRCMEKLSWQDSVGALLLSPWVGRMKRRIRAAGMACNDILVGLQATGRMDSMALSRALHCLPHGVLAEVYFHPASRQTPLLRQLMPQYRPVAEWQSLLNPDLASYVREACFVCGSFRDFSGSR
ncbi:MULTISPECIES: hopanoid biosynthesis-associated protein HpnK [Acidithiobacillus]|uniref:YdjC-like family protein n=2 Tax=Acidithiobacillus caldus TaxID=33059 RepID=F9ZRN8_ACICS|nr:MULTISPECIES: hopanoid biosynthesis-associated protein HpnK [Acidithiobacillus]AEK58883.1 YdjC-like family protein [Acidithiobacillus caldus SM-1]AIA55931.1 cellobiose phosphotransferase system celC [Acidithiobacillus caldus ATCC 51756]AUW33293.1 ChbG/HpnK family deacetylase [Acidithiobacillus caldus]MBU2728317.1 hopanoid biosynthesis-associated protein HpnK [Acidithiobacillus caldus]MBU2737058.1 hopanoid biosynthesis-associated protein HpnK [Acidithiobacillus caldus ATCC 51756]